MSLGEEALDGDFDAIMGVCVVAGAEEEGVDEDGEGGVVVQLRHIEPSLCLVLSPPGLLAQRVIFEKHAQQEDETPDVRINKPNFNALAEYGET